MADYEDATDWHTPESLRTPPDTEEPAVWETADDIPTALLTDLLNVARESVLEFAKVLPEDYPLGKCPPSYRLAHLLQTRNLWNAVEVDGDGGYGEGDFMVRPVPLDWMIKQVLRPRGVRPVAL